MRICLAVFVATGLACGPSIDVEPGTGSASASGDETTASASASTTSATSSTASTTTSASSTATGPTATTSDDGSTSSSPTPDLPGADCVPPPPGIEPPLVDGCEHAWLVDAKGNPMEGAYSGLVECRDPNPTRADVVVYRTAAIGCPELIGNECLCDADCDAGQACICANTATTSSGLGLEPRNRCMIADCASAEDCGGAQCRIDYGICKGAPYPEAIRCTTPGDDCVFPSDCAPRRGGLCDYDEVDELFSCEFGAICE